MPLPPIHVVALFPELDEALLELLDSLAPEDWTRPTVCSQWTVRDIAAHLLDGTLRRLASQRDGHRPPAPDVDFSDYRALVGYLNRLNAQWVTAARRLSPRQLRDLLEDSGRQLCAFLETVDPFGPAPFPVSWAGEDTSQNWFDLAREFTEKWHHQQQIRDAVGSPPLTARRFLHPVLETFLRGVPHHYRDVKRPPGTELAIRITGPAGGEWTLQRAEQSWTLAGESASRPAAAISLTEDLAWRVFTNGVSPAEAEAGWSLEGDAELARPLLSARSVMV